MILSAFLGPARQGRDLSDLVWVLLALGLVIVLGLLSQRHQRRLAERAEEERRRDPDRGGTGFTPADLRPATPPTRSAPLDPVDAWLLGLAAPRVEWAALLQDAWGLLPADADEDWRTRLDAVLAGYDASTRQSWEAQVTEAEQEFAMAEPPPTGSDQPSIDRPGIDQPGIDQSGIDLAAADAARVAMLYRLGVAAGHLTEAEARRRTLALGRGLRGRFTDWFGYGDAWVAGHCALAPADRISARATARHLYSPGGPWADLHWPALPEE